MKAGKRDYEAIADLLHRERAQYYQDVNAFKQLVNDMADILSKSNPAFNRVKFTVRCIEGKSV